MTSGICDYLTSPPCLAERPLQQHGGEEGGQDDDDEKGAILALSDDPAGEAHAGEDQADLPAREHADPNRPSIDGPAHGSETGRKLPSHGGDG